MHIHGHDVTRVCPAELPARSTERVAFARERQRAFYERLPDVMDVHGVTFEKQWRDRGAVEGGSPAYYAKQANLVVGVCIRDDWYLTEENVEQILEINRAYFADLIRRIPRIASET